MLQQICYSKCSQKSMFLCTFLNIALEFMNIALGEYLSETNVHHKNGRKTQENVMFTSTQTHTPYQCYDSYSSVYAAAFAHPPSQCSPRPSPSSSREQEKEMREEGGMQREESRAKCSLLYLKCWQCSLAWLCTCKNKMHEQERKEGCLYVCVCERKAERSTHVECIGTATHVHKPWSAKPVI